MNYSNVYYLPFGWQLSTENHKPFKKLEAGRGLPDMLGTQG